MNNIELFKEFEKNLSFKVTDDIYSSFQQCSGDLNPLHVDKSFAKGKGFLDVVMYGNILNAFISYTIGMELPTKEVILQLQDIQYKNPVYLNDELKLNIKAVDVQDEWSVVIFKYKFLNQNGIIVAKGNIQIGVFE